MKTKKRLKRVGTVFLVVLLSVAAILIYYTVREYRPDEVEAGLVTLTDYTDRLHCQCSFQDFIAGVIFLASQDL